METRFRQHLTKLHNIIPFLFNDKKAAKQLSYRNI